MSDYWLVQRLKRSFHADREPKETDGLLQKIRNPFGYGTLGDYDLDYMGSAEFEFGAIPEAGKELNNGTLVLGTYTYKDVEFDFLWREEDGEPWGKWIAWADDGFKSKESPYTLPIILGEREPWGGDTIEEVRDDIHVWWGLSENVLWGLRDGDNGHLLRMLESMSKQVHGEN